MKLKTYVGNVIVWINTDGLENHSLTVECALQKLRGAPQVSDQCRSSVRPCTTQLDLAAWLERNAATVRRYPRRRIAIGRLLDPTRMSRNPAQHRQRLKADSSLNRHRLSAIAKWNQLNLGTDAPRVRRVGCRRKEGLYTSAEKLAVDTRQGFVLASVPSASANTSSSPVIH